MPESIYMSPPELTRENLFQAIHHMRAAEYTAEQMRTKLEESGMSTSLYGDATDPIFDVSA